MSDSGATDPDDICNWLRVDARITTSGKLQAADPARLAAIGVRHVINLALDTHPDALPDAAQEMARAGLRYTHIPVPFNAPQEGHYLAFRAAMEADDELVHIHCIMNYRVSAMLYRWHREQGMAEPEAHRLMARIWTPQTSDLSAAPAWTALVETPMSGAEK